ncbi:MAG: DinB family protein [Chitinophagaceae bacterium]|nr:DinB family protein [Chitinophagaceae bacterium]
MLKQSLTEIFERDLKKLQAEILLYNDENDLWTVKNNISNSAGNLCLHLVGNLNHFVGAVLGNTGFVRDRDSEFTLKNIPRKQLVDNIDKLIETVKNTLSRLPDADLGKEYPEEKHGEKITTDFMLLHLLTHFNYHLGQINYHRRLLT